MARTLREFAHSSIRNLIHTEIDVFNPDEPASKVLGVLEDHEHYEAVVKDDGRVGLVTVRDLLDIVQPSQTKIGDHPKDLWRVYESVTPEDTVLSVTDSLIRKRIRALPVVEEGRVLGFICQVEITEALAEIPELSKIPAEQLMKTPVISLDASDSVANARRVMLDNSFSHIPVTNEEKLIGLVTAKDMVHTFVTPIGVTTVGDRIGERIPRLTGSLGDIMDKRVLKASPDASARDIAKMFKRFKKGACIITDDYDEIVGIITPRELMAPLLRFKGESILPVYIVGLTEHEGFFEKAVAESKVRRVVERSLKFHPQMNEVSIRIKRQQREGNRVRYQVNARALSPVEQFNVTEEGWDLLSVFDEVCEALDRKLRDAKPQKGSLRLIRKGRK